MYLFKRKSLTVILSLLVVLSGVLIPAPTYAATFGDINGHWAQTYIDTIKPLGVIAGYPDGTFKPDQQVKRIEFIAIAVNSLGTAPRKLQADENWVSYYAEMATELKLINTWEYGGLTETNLNAFISREEMASIVVNAYYTTGSTVSESQLQSARSKLTDLDQVSKVYYDQAVAAVALGIIDGFSDNTFKPLNNSTRAQAAAVSHKLLSETGVIEKVSSDPSLSLSTAYAVNGIEIGDSYDWIINKYGNPVREEISEYGFKWLVYHTQFADYYMVGIQGGKVVALFTASDLLTTTIGLEMNLTKSQVTSILGTPFEWISKGSTQYMQYNNSETATYQKNNAYVTAFFDTANSGKMFLVKIVDQTVENAFRSQYGTPSDALRVAFEQQLFDLTNVYRKQFGKSMLTWNESVAEVARKHSKDMAVRNFFDHTNPSGYTPFDRLLADGINYSLAAENIAAGYTNAFSVHSGWVNSPGHRDNLLRSINELGIGVYFGGDYFNYYTQNFITP